jgi:hypothetical protein
MASWVFPLSSTAGIALQAPVAPSGGARFTCSVWLTIAQYCVDSRDPASRGPRLPGPRGSSASLASPWNCEPTPQSKTRHQRLPAEIRSRNGRSSSKFRTQRPGRLILPPPNFSDSLRPQRRRPTAEVRTATRACGHCRAAEQRDELAPSHSRHQISPGERNASEQKSDC